MYVVFDKANQWVEKEGQAGGWDPGQASVQCGRGNGDGMGQFNGYVHAYNI